MSLKINEITGEVEEDESTALQPYVDELNELSTDETMEIGYMLQQFHEKWETFRKLYLFPLAKTSYAKTKIKTIVGQYLRITFIPAEIVKRFDVKRFKREHPDLYEKYCVEEMRDETVRVTII